MRRVVSLAISLLLLTPLLIAGGLSPDPRGVGTHEQLGMLGFQSCPFLEATGHPCMTCGMTTSFSLAAHGRFVQAFAVQPFGFLLALGCAVGFWVALHVALFDSRAHTPLAVLTRPRVLWTLVALLLVSWGYKFVTYSHHAHTEEAPWHESSS